MTTTFHAALTGDDIHEAFSYGPEAWVDSRAYATLALADAAAYAAGKLLLITKNHTLTADTTLTASTKVLPGGGFTKSSTYTLTINGLFEAGPFLIFTSFTGTISSPDIIFGAGTVREICPEWWGAIADGATDSTAAIQLAIDCASTFYGKVLLNYGKYLISDTLEIANRIVLEGKGYGNPSTSAYRYGTMIQKTTDDIGILVKSGCRNAILQNFTLYSALGSGVTDGIQNGEGDATNGAGETIMRRLWIQGMAGNGITVVNGNVGIIDECVCNANYRGIYLNNLNISTVNVNAWRINNCKTNSNLHDGLHIGIAPANYVWGHVSEGNTGYGVYCNRAWNVIFAYCEANTAGNLYLDTNAYNGVYFVHCFPANAVVTNGNNWVYSMDFSGVYDFALALKTGELVVPNLLFRADRKLLSTDFIISRWGTGSTLTVASNSYDSKFQVTVTAGIAPDGVYADILFIPPTGVPDNPISFAQMVSGSGDPAPIAVFPAGEGYWAIRYLDTPVDTKTYVINVLFVGGLS